MTNDNERAVPSAAERAAIREMMDNYDVDWKTGSLLVDIKLQDYVRPTTMRRLLAAVDALESENARLREALEADDRSVDRSIAYLNSTSGGITNEAPDYRSADQEKLDELGISHATLGSYRRARDQADYHNQFIGETEGE